MALRKRTFQTITCFLTGALFVSSAFANVIPNRPGKVEVPNQDVTAGATNLYDVTVDENAAFRSGIRFTDIPAAQSAGPYFDSNRHQFDFQTDVDGEVEFSTRAIVPSAQVITGGRPNSFLLKPAGKNIPIQVQVQNVDGRGDLVEGDFSTLIFDESASPESPLVQFDPWPKLFLSDKPGNAEPTNPLQFLMGEAVEVYEYITSQSEKILPVAFRVFLSGIVPDGTTFVDEDLDQEGGYPTDYTGGTNVRENSVETHLQASGGAISNISVAFTSKIQYDMTDDDSSTRTVVFPGGNLGNNVGGEPLFDLAQMEGAIGADNTDISGIMLGADIEGQILTQDENYTYQEGGGIDDMRVLRMGNVRAKDVREAITRNAYVQTRASLANDSSSTRDFDVTAFVDGEVTYFKNGMVRLGAGGTPSAPRVINDGRHTIVIENGNLLIAGDMRYATADDSLGVVLINSRAGAKPQIGNIFVYTEVKNFVGTYFADGALTSTVNNVNPKMIDLLDREDKDILGNQLLLEGTLLTQNTLGGGMLEPLINPWGPENDRAEAQKYDLHFIRRYYPQTDEEGNPSNEGSCVVTNGACDPNKHSFVIRPDSRIQNVPPPGFRE